MPASFAEGLVGIVLDDRYRLDALLGEGGMGAVYRAHHLAMDRKVAVKLLKPHLTSDDAALQRFLREARSTMKVDSEHAVKVLDFGITPHRDYYMVLEYLDGRTVQQELDIDGPFSPSRATHIARQALHALGAAHARGLVHRDIKPDNILLLRVGDDPDFAKVLDFGVAKLMDGAAQSSRSALAITQAGMVFGTPEFMSPEQACGQPLDGRSDLYSLAATMFAMLTGCGLFRAKTAIEWLTNHARTPAPHLADGLPALAPYTALDAALQTCLAKRADQRPQSAAEMIALLDALEPTLGAPRTSTPPRSAAIRTVFSPSTFIASIDPDATLDPEAARALGQAQVSTAPSSSRSLAPRAEGEIPATTTGLLAASRSRRGLWLALGGSAVVAVLVTTAIVATRREDTSSAVAAKHSEPPPASPTAVASSPAVADAAKVPSGTSPPPPPGTSDASAKSPPGTSEVAPMPPDAADARGARKPPPGTSQTTAPARRIAPQVATHIANAEAAQKAGNRLRQLAEADAALRSDPRNARARFLFADALIASGDLDRGCRYLRDLRKNPTARARARQAGCPTN